MMEALDGLAVAAEVQTLLQSLLGSEQDVSQHGSVASPTTVTEQRKIWLLQEAFAHVRFFANLPPEVRELCSLEPFAVSQPASKAGDKWGAQIYKQGAKLEEHTGLFVILHGEVVLYSHAQDSQTLAETMRLRAGDAFGDEVLFADHESAGSVVRATSAFAPESAIVIRLTSNKVLRAIAGWLMQQPSLLYFLHPRLCLDALRKTPATRSPTELVRVAQCLDAVGVFGNRVGENTGLEVASSIEFADVLPGEHVFQEGDHMDACFVLIHGRMLLYQNGAAPDASHPHTSPQFGNAVDELCAGDVLLDPAPWLRGAWPCTAVAATRAGVVKIPQFTYTKLRQSGVAFQPRQFLQLLRKPAHTRTRLDNQRVAQFLSAFPSMHEVALDKRIELAGFLNLATYGSGELVSAKAHQELIVLSGHARAVENETSVTAPHGEAEHAERSIGSSTPAGSMLKKWLETCVAKGFSLTMAVRLSTHHDLSEYTSALEKTEGQADADASRALFLGKVAPFLSCMEFLMLDRSLRSIKAASLNDTFATDTGLNSSDAGRARPADDVTMGHVIGWHTFPSRNRKNFEAVRVSETLSVAVLMHRDIEGSESAHIFRRGSVYIHAQWQNKLIEALRSSPQYRSPEDLADVMSGLKNVPPLSLLQPTQPEAVREVCGQIILHELAPGAKICAQGHKVDEVLIILKGTVKSIVFSKDICNPRAFWVGARAAVKLATLHGGKPSANSHFSQGQKAKTGQMQGQKSKQPQSASHARLPTFLHHAPSEDQDTHWGREHECVAVYGPGDSVGFADMIVGSWCSSLLAGHRGCSIAAIPKHVLDGHRKFLISSMNAAVSPGSCTGMLNVPRRFFTQEQQMMLHMMLASVPSFAGLSEQCVAKLASRTLHLHLSAHQLLYVQGEDAEVHALVMKGRLASYSGLPDAVRAIISPQAGGYVDPQLFHHAPPSLAQKLYRLVKDDLSSDRSLEDEALWEQSEIYLDLDGNLSYRKGSACVALGNIRQELTDFKAPVALLTQCRLKVTGAAEPVGQASQGEHEVKVGHAANLVVLHFGSTIVTFWLGDKDALCLLLLCIVRHWISGAGHPLGSLIKTVDAEGEVGTALLQNSRPIDRTRHHLSAFAGHSGDHDERPSTANASRGQVPTNASRGTVPKKKEEGEEEASRGTVPKNATSVLALEPSELLLLRKRDVEDVMVELCCERLLSTLKSLGQDGTILANEMEENSSHLLPDIVSYFQPCKFQATQFLFHAGKRIEEIFFVTSGKVNLLYPFVCNVPKETHNNGPGSRHMPAVRGHRAADKLVGVSLVHGPCFLGIHKNTQMKLTGVVKCDSEETVHGMSAQAVNSVEGYALKIPFTSASNMAELKKGFFDKFLKCMDRLSLLHDEGMSKMQVATGSTEALLRPPPVLAHEPLHSENRPAEAGAQARRLSTSRRSKRRIGVGRYDTQASVRGAAADLGASEWRTCLDAGVTSKNYGECIQCPNCMRLTYPEQHASCHHCGMLIEGREWEPKLDRMDAAAVSTVEHLRYLRDQKRALAEPHPEFKPGTRHEQMHSSYSTIMSHDNKHFDNRNFVLSLDMERSSRSDLDRAYFEHRSPEERATSIDHAEITWEAAPEPNQAEAHRPESDGSTRQYYALRPRTSDGILTMGAGFLQERVAASRTSDVTKPTTKRLTRPQSSAASLGNGIGTSASVAMELDAMSREQRRFLPRGRAAMKSPDEAWENRRYERSRSALANPSAGNPSAALSAYFKNVGRPRTSPVAQKYLVSLPKSSPGLDSPKPLASEALLTQLDIMGLAAPRAPQDHVQPIVTPQIPDMTHLNINLEDFRARRYAHTLSSVLKVNPAWFLDAGAHASVEQTQAVEQTGLQYSRGPSPFLVCSSTRSQVILRRSAPKYQHLAKLHVGVEGAVF
jgi:CRP-like cAMP-binding protein